MACEWRNMKTKPNIIFIMADDLGFGDLGCFNFGRSRTPAIDRLVAEGSCLTQHYSGSAVCGPARACLLTGRQPIRTGMIDLASACGRDQLLPDEITMGDEFKRLGYATGLMGKWHCGAVQPFNHPNNRGFDEFVGFRAGTWNYLDRPIDYNGTWRDPDGRHMTDIISSESIDFVKRHQNEPFFLHIAHHAPHHPFQVPDRWADPYRETGLFTEAVSRIYGMVEQMDDGIGRLLDTLDELKLADNTIVIFTSDNGPQFGENDQMGSYRRFNCGWRGNKGTIFEGGIRVPCIVRWPDGMERVAAHHAFAHFSDWLPTLLAAAGGTPTTEKELAGQSLLPLLQGEAQNVNPTHFWQWTWHTPMAHQCAALRDGDWKLVRPTAHDAMVWPYSDPELARVDGDMVLHPERYLDYEAPPWHCPALEVPAAEPLLFNLAVDPLETTSLADTYPDRFTRMSADLDRRFEAAVDELRQATDGRLP